MNVINVDQWAFGLADSTGDVKSVEDGALYEPFISTRLMVPRTNDNFGLMLFNTSVVKTIGERLLRRRHRSVRRWHFGVLPSTCAIISAPGIAFAMSPT